MALVLQAASREALAAATSRLDSYADATQPGELAITSDELFAVTRLLVEHKPLRRILGDSTSPEGHRVELLTSVLGSKLSPPALEQVEGLVRARWSRSLDLIDAAETLARRAALAVAEKDGTLDDVEDQLFRFGRILDREPELATLLTDSTTPADNRIALLDQVLGGKVRPATAFLLQQTVRLHRGRHLDLVAEELAELAAARRERSVAKVRTPVVLSAQQEEKLAGSLGRIYGRPMSLQIELEPDLLGGLVVQVGGEVIDGSVAGRIATARRSLPR